MSLGEIWPKPQSLAIARLRLCEPAEVIQRRAEVEVSLGVRRIDGQNLAIGCLSLKQPSGSMVNEGPLK